MAYTPENNPYIPGDPYSYDLKWIVAKIKNLESNYEQINSKIAESVIKALNTYGGPILYDSIQALTDSQQKAGTLAYIIGYYVPGDGGNTLYFITDDYNDIISAPVYITMNEPNKWALPIILDPYVRPEQFGAYGDGITDDHDAINIAVKNYDTVVFSPGKTYYLNGPINMIHDGSVLDGNKCKLKNGFAGNAIGSPSGVLVDTVLIKDFEFIGAGKTNPLGTWPNVNSAVIIATNKKNITVKNCVVRDFHYGIFIGGEDGYNCNIIDCEFYDCNYAIDTFVIDGFIIKNCTFYDCTAPIQIEPNAGIWTKNIVIENCSTFRSGSYSLNLHERNRQLVVRNCNFDHVILSTGGNFENCSIIDVMINMDNNNVSSGFGGDTVIKNCTIQGDVTSLISGWAGIIKDCIIKSTGHAFSLGTGSFKIFDCIVDVPNNKALIQGGGQGSPIIKNIHMINGAIGTNHTFSNVILTGYTGTQWPTYEISILDTSERYYNAPNSI